MADRASRPRRLAPPRVQPRPGSAASSQPPRAAASKLGAGDLFEHFGVGVNAPRGHPQAVIEGQPCPGCGWLLRTDDSAPCMLCGCDQTS